MNKYAKVTVDGLVTNNPTFRLVLGTCASLALSTSALNALGMGLSVTFVLLVSNLAVSLLRKLIPEQVRIPAFVIIIATLVTLLRMVLEKYLPDLFDAMGIYLPLIVVNCIILGRAEAFASKNTPVLSVLDGLSTGIGFAVALTAMGTVREILGKGSIFGVRLWEFTIPFFSGAAGAFFTYGLLIALFSAATAYFGGRARARRARALQAINGEGGETCSK